MHYLVCLTNKCYICINTTRYVCINNNQYHSKHVTLILQLWKQLPTPNASTWNIYQVRITRYQVLYIVDSLYFDGHRRSRFVMMNDQLNDDIRARERTTRYYSIAVDSLSLSAIVGPGLSWWATNWTIISVRENVSPGIRVDSLSLSAIVGPGLSWWTTNWERWYEAREQWRRLLNYYSCSLAILLTVRRTVPIRFLLRLRFMLFILFIGKHATLHRGSTAI